MDNVANMVAALQARRMKEMRYMSPTLNLAVQNVLEGIENTCMLNIIEWAIKVPVHFDHSVCQ